MVNGNPELPGVSRATAMSPWSTTLNTGHEMYHMFLTLVTSGSLVTLASDSLVSPLSDVIMVSYRSIDISTLSSTQML